MAKSYLTEITGLWNKFILTDPSLIPTVGEGGGANHQIFQFGEHREEIINYDYVLGSIILSLDTPLYLHHGDP